jgi:O-antigen/teichoic acid export membrane protein
MELEFLQYCNSTNRSLMKSSTTTSQNSPPTTTWQADSFGVGLLALFASNVLQRGLGFARNLFFCWLLLDSELGIWSLIQSFLFLAAPLAVLGLPGSYARYVEYYRQRGTLRPFLSQTALITGVSSLLFVGLLILGPRQLTEWITGTAQSTRSIALISLSLLSVILFNSLTELVTGLRQIRLVSKMHFLNSLTFTLVGVIALLIAPRWESIVAAFAISYFIGSLPALTLLAIPISLSPKNETLDRASAIGSTKLIWQRLFPYALALWSMNLLTNMFDVADRYMLLYWLEDGLEHGRVLVGQYHAARIFPLLLLSLASMLSSIMLPYISADWESGDRHAAGLRITDGLKLSSFVLWTASLTFMIPAPWIYELLLQGRYQLGLQVQPGCLLITIWGALFLMAQNYIWCAERGRLVVLVSALGLFSNIALNACLIPSFGLAGAVTATWLANGLVLALTIWTIKKLGCTIDRALIISLLGPVSLLLGTSLSACCLATFIIVAVRTSWLVDRNDLQRLEQQLQRFAKFLPKRWLANGLLIPSSQMR